MQKLFKKLIFITLLFVGTCAHGMKMQYEQPEGKELVSFVEAKRKANETGDIGLLQKFFSDGVGLNELHVGEYPICTIIRGRYPSTLMAAAMCNGARVDLPDCTGYTVFNIIALCPKHGWQKEYAYFPKMNLLAAFALQETYDYKLRDPEFERKLQEIRQARIHSALLCINRIPELRSVRYCILAHMLEHIYTVPLFAKVIDHVQDHESLMRGFPFKMFQKVALKRSGIERELFAAKFAQLFARHRLKWASGILGIEHRNALRDAKNSVDTIYKEARGSKEILQSAQETAHDLEPEGFIERHMPDCTRIIENVLLGNEPFQGFEFK